MSTRPESGRVRFLLPSEWFALGRDAFTCSINRAMRDTVAGAASEPSLRRRKPPSIRRAYFMRNHRYAGRVEPTYMPPAYRPPRSLPLSGASPDRYRTTCAFYSSLFRFRSWTFRKRPVLRGLSLPRSTGNMPRDRTESKPPFTRRTWGECRRARFEARCAFVVETCRNAGCCGCEKGVRFFAASEYASAR
jgi:hypothetical protein